MIPPWSRIFSTQPAALTFLPISFSVTALQYCVRYSFSLEQFLQSFQYINCRRLTGGKVLSYGHSDYDRHCYAALYHSLSAQSSPAPHNSAIYYITKMRNCQYFIRYTRKITRKFSGAACSHLFQLVITKSVVDGERVAVLNVPYDVFRTVVHHKNALCQSRLSAAERPICSSSQRRRSG